MLVEDDGAVAQTLTDALPYMQKYSGKRFVIKYGGHAMVDPELEKRPAYQEGSLTDTPDLSRYDE